MTVPARTLAIIALVAAAGLIYLRVRKVEHRVYVVNGLDVPLDVNITGTHVTVPAQGHVAATVKVRRSLWFVASRTDGTEVDRQSFTPRKDGGPVVYNVLAATPMFTAGEMYSFSGITIDKPHDGDHIMYQPFVQRAGIDFYFDVPQHIPKPSKPGPVEKWFLKEGGDWKSTVQWLVDNKRLDDAIKLAEAVRIAEPDSSEVATVVERLDQIKHPPPAPPPKSPHDWTVYSPHEEARLVQVTKDDGSCEARCEVKTSGFVWSRGACLASNADDRFVAPDCSRVVIVRRTMEAPDSVVVSVYASPGSPSVRDESHRALELTASTARGEWLASPAHLDKNQRSIELETVDHKTHTFPLWP